MTGAREGRRDWGDALGIYLHGRVLAMLFLGFSAGLPFLLVFSTLSAWLREAEVTRTTIGFFSWVGITYSIKFFWAPVVDRLPLPYLTRRLGRRRSWMLVAMAGIAAGLLGMASVDPAQNLTAMALFALLVAFSSATQDVAIDAYRIEAVDSALQGAMAATYQLGYRIALLAAGAGVLYAADLAGWPFSYRGMAALTLVGIATVLVIAEPVAARDDSAIQREARVVRFIARSAHMPARRRAAMAWFIGAVVCPFVDFFARNGAMAVLILLFVSLFRLSDITMGVMAYPFYIDLGFSKSEIATVVKLFGFFATVLGAFLGGVLVARYGVMGPLLLGAVLIAATNLLFAGLAAIGRDLTFLTLVISADNMTGGFAGTVFIAYLSSLTNTAYTATQYALFSSLMTLPGKLLGGASGAIVDAYGYVEFFIYAAVVGLPAILLALVLTTRAARPPAPPDATSGPRKGAG